MEGIGLIKDRGSNFSGIFSSQRGCNFFVILVLGTTFKVGNSQSIGKREQIVGKEMYQKLFLKLLVLIFFKD